MKSFTQTRKALLAGLVSVTFFCATSPAQAQVPAPSFKPHIYLGGGTALISNPIQDKDMFNQSFSLMIAVGLPVKLGFEVMPKFQYHKFGVNNSSTLLLATGLPIVDPNRSVTTLGADVKWSFLPGPVPTKPYFLVGGGTSSLSQDATGLLFQNISERKFYMNVGLGMDVKLGPTFAFFVEGKYTYVNSSLDNLGFFPLMAGIRIL